MPLRQHGRHVAGARLRCSNLGIVPGRVPGPAVAGFPLEVPQRLVGDIRAASYQGDTAKRILGISNTAVGIA